MLPYAETLMPSQKFDARFHRKTFAQQYPPLVAETQQIEHEHDDEHEHDSPTSKSRLNIRRHQSRIALSAARIESECMTSCSKGWLLARSSSTSIPSPG